MYRRRRRSLAAAAKTTRAGGFICGDDDEGATKEERLRKEATSPTHLLCHFPKNPFCWICGLSDITMSVAA